MVTDHLGRQDDPLVDWQIGESDHARVRGSSDEQQLTEVVVERDQDSAFGCRSCQERRVAWIVFDFAGVEDIVPLVPQPFRQAAAGAAVDEELHRLSTETAASVSPAITACAYAMHARMSSCSSFG